MSMNLHFIWVHSLSVWLVWGPEHTVTSIFICLFFKKYLLPWLSTSASNSADWPNMFSFSYWLALISKIKYSLRKSLVSLLMLEHNPRDNSLKEKKVIWLTILEIPGCDQTAFLFPMWWSKTTNQGRREGEEKTEAPHPPSRVLSVS